MENNTYQPLVIIMQGGAMRAAFGAGVLYEFGKRGLYPDVIASLSASVPTAAYYVAGQHDEMRNIYTQGLGNIISIKNLIFGKPVYDINHLLHKTLRTQYPLSVDALASSKTRFVIPIFNYQTGKVELHSNHDPHFTEDVWSLLHVSLIVHPDHILRNTPFEPYVDGALDPMTLFKNDFFPDNARVVVIWNESDFSMHWMKYLGHKIFKLLQMRNAPPEVARIIKIREQLVSEGLGAYETFLQRIKPEIIIPDKRSPFEGIDVLRGGRGHLTRLFEHGREKAQTALLGSFFATSKDPATAPGYPLSRRALRYTS